MEKAPVPKFASFKKKDASKPDKHHSGGDEGACEHRRHHRQRHHHDIHHDSELGREVKGKGEHGGSRDGRRLHARDRDAELVHAKPVQSINALDFHESDLFMLDRRGDSKNIEYGSLHRYSVPSYHRSGCGHVVGIPPPAKISREESTDKEVVLAVGRRINHHSHTSSKLLTSKHGRTRETKLRFVATASDAPAESVESDYIDLRPSRKRKRDADDPTTDAAAVDYRSIEGKAKAPEPLHDEDVDFASDSESDGANAEDIGRSVRQENAVLSKQARADPTNIERWLALVEHQATLVRPGADPATLTIPERHTLADLRLTVLREARKHIGKNCPGRERLLLTTLEEGALLWDSTKLGARWHEALAECATSTSLWTTYVDHIQDQHIDFSYESCKQAYVQCLRVLADVGANETDQQRAHIADVQVYILLRYTIFIRDAGYAELATAIWQAVLEYHFFLPKTLLHATESERMHALESFWDSDVPRIGEAKAQGWCEYFEAGVGETRSTPGRETSLPTATNVYADFAIRELQLSRWIVPALADDDDAVRDPFRCVMFSDISDVVGLLTGSLSTGTVIQGFLNFLGFPLLQTSGVDDHCRSWLVDPHLAASNAGQARDGAQQRSTDTVRLRCCRETSQSLFARSDHAFERFSSTAGHDSQLAHFASSSLEALVSKRQDDDILAEYYLAFKLHLWPQDAAKIARRLLKARSSSMRLYNAYAMIEMHQNNESKAHTVWSTALQMQSSLGSSEQDDAILLWHSRELVVVRSSEARGDASLGLRYLLDIGNEVPANADLAPAAPNDQMLRLRTTRKLEEGLDRMSLSQRYEHAAMFADCLAWLSYLSSSHDLAAATQVYEEHSSRMQRESALISLELLQQHKAAMISIHLQHQRPCKLALLRNEIETSLSWFPSNSILLGLRSTISSHDRLRTLIHDQKISSRSEVSVVQWSYKTADEIARMGDASSGSNPNTVRATLSNALTRKDSTAKHAAALWFSWLRFECDRASYPEKIQKLEALASVKQVFLTGLRHLPWLKHWVIVGMDFFAKAGLPEDDLRQMFEVLVERGLRLRVDVEDPA